MRQPNTLPPGMMLATEVRSNFVPPIEIVEGLLTAESGSMIFGASNSGKTFLALDMACAVSQGKSWLGCRTNKGLVIYIAAESAGSIKARLHAYQQHHKCQLDNLIVVQQPLNLMIESETHGLIDAIKKAANQIGLKCTLIIGDTLARMTAGANENNGEDMSRVIANFDLVRRETGAHFCLIHHAGKDPERGARGHSSLRAAVDTEIEVAAVLDDGGNLVSRVARVTKQRDLQVGEQIDFDLQVVEIGSSQWGEPVTSCVVVGGAEDKPCPPSPPKKTTKTKNKRTTEVQKISPNDGWEPMNRGGFNPEEWKPNAPVNPQRQDWGVIEKSVCNEANQKVRP